MEVGLGGENQQKKFGPCHSQLEEHSPGYSTVSVATGNPQMRSGKNQDLAYTSATCLKVDWWLNESFKKDGPSYSDPAGRPYLVRVHYDMVGAIEVGEIARSKIYNNVTEEEHVDNDVHCYVCWRQYGVEAQEKLWGGQERRGAGHQQREKVDDRRAALTGTVIKMKQMITIESNVQ